MRSGRLLRATTLLVALAAVGACGDGTGPSDVTVNDLLADVTDAQSLSAAPLQAAGVAVETPAARVDASACAFNATTRMFVCPSTTVNGVTFSRSFQLFDASDAPQSAYSPATTAAIRLITDVSGTVTSTTGTVTTVATLIAHDDAKLSGLLTRTRFLNSSGNADATVTAGGIPHSIATDHSIVNLELADRGSANRYPRSGSIAVDVTARTFGLTNIAEVTMTFNGTSTATMLVTVNGVTRSCTIDLSRRGAFPDCAA